MKRTKERGITIIALIITVIVMLILAGVAINLSIGKNGIFRITKEATEETKVTSVIEKVKLILADYMLEKQLTPKALEEYLIELKEKGELEEVVNNGNGTITIEVEGYEITIREEDLRIIETIKISGVKPIFDVYITKIDGTKIEESEEETLEQKAITINIKNIGEYGENYTIEIKDGFGKILTKETNIIPNVMGQASYIINKSGIYTITVVGISQENPRTVVKTEEIKVNMPIIEESAMFSKAHGVIEIVWLNENNTVRTENEGPISPAEHLGGLTAIKYSKSENKWVEADKNNSENDWYNYVAQIGNIDEKTSNWANAKSSDSNAYFVWIPRYAYKITYFSSSAQARAYRESGSTEGIVGYSNIEGIVKVENGVEKLVKDSKPTNVMGKVETNQYADYIPHPAFEFEGSKAGIWVGKFESSGSKTQVKIIPNTTSLRNIKVGDIFTACLDVKNTYNLIGDSHMMKNIEWGAVAYLAESKYGRNGVEITINGSEFVTGGGNYTGNVLQSTTGNIYGIYDMCGGANEYVAGTLTGKLSNSYYNFTNIDSKYYDIYATNYNESKRIKGDALYETSTNVNSSANVGNAWNGDFSRYVFSNYPMWGRGRL